MESPLCPPGTRLIETLLWDGTTLVRRERHLARARASAAALGFRWDEETVRAALTGARGPAPLRVRLTFGRDGDVEMTTAPLPPTAAEWRVTLASDRLDPADPFLRHKTTQCARYDTARAALPEGIDEVIFANSRDEICEGTITNVFFDRGDGLCTPPLASGVLPGVLRAELIATGSCREAPLPVTDLAHVRLWVGNSLRGLIRAQFVQPSQSQVRARPRG